MNEYSNAKDYEDGDGFMKKCKVINHNLRYGSYDLPTLRVEKHNLSEIVDSIESNGFNFIKDVKVNGKTKGTIEGTIEGGLPFAARDFSGNISFRLNETDWLMYSREYDKSRDVVFLSEKKDLILTHDDDVKQSQDALDVMKLNKFLKDYKQLNNHEDYTNMSTISRIAKADRFAAHFIGGFLPVLCGLLTGAGAYVAKGCAQQGTDFLIHGGDDFKQLIPFFGAMTIGAAGGFVYYYKDMLSKHKSAIRVIDDSKQLFIDNLYVPGEYALEYINKPKHGTVVRQ